MTVNVNELDLPYIHPKILPTDLDMYEQLEMARNAFKDSWIATTNMSYIILDHQHATNMLKDERWHNALTFFTDSNPNVSDKFKENQRRLIINLEGEEHTNIRQLIAPVFSAKSANDLRPIMRKTINDLIDEVIKNNKCDISKDIFEKYPIYVMSNILGVPVEDGDKFGEWTSIVFKNFSMRFVYDSKEMIEVQKKLDLYTKQLIENKKKNPGNDIISYLVKLQENNSQLSDIQIFMLIQALLMAGIDTVKGQLGLIFLKIFSNKDLVKMLENDQNVEQIIEEATRMDSVFRMLIRIASEDIEYNGVLFPKGTLMSPSLVSANYDEKVFENPDDFIIDRPNRKAHTLAYGGGIHKCLGIAFARAEMQECMVAIAKRMKNIEIIDKVIYKDTTEPSWGPISIPISFSV